MMRLQSLALSVAVMSTLGFSAAAVAQRDMPLGPNGKCIIQIEGVGAGSRVQSTKVPTGKAPPEDFSYNTFAGGGFRGVCQGQDVHLISDSAEYYGDAHLLYLIGHVHYIEPRATIDADRMTYETLVGHLKAEGNVHGVMKDGTTMDGPVADYYRIVPNVRQQTMLIATGRPKLAVVQIDSTTGKPSDTVHVEADHITTVADSLTYAGGNVHLTRPEMFANGDSAFVDNGTGRAKLMGKPTVEARRERPFTLTGGVIDVYSENKKVNRVVATPNGHATSQDLQLFADSIDLRVTENTLQRAIAWGKTGARALSPTQDITADSIDAVLPDQRIRELHAVRKAYATTVPDTATITTTDRDWMRGDTIIARFDTVITGDTSKSPPIKSIASRINAKAYYHISNRDDKTKPGINYVVGRNIDVAFEDRQVQTVTVIDRAGGVYLEPSTDSTKVAPKPKLLQPKQSRPRGRIR